MRMAKRLWIAVVVMLPIVTIATAMVRPDFLPGVISSPVAWLGALAMIAGLGAALLGLFAGKETMAHHGASWCIAGLLGGAAAAIFPVMLRSTLSPAFSMTAHTGAADAYSLKVGLFWWPVAAALSLSYAWVISKRYRGKERL